MSPWKIAGGVVAVIVATLFVIAARPHADEDAAANVPVHRPSVAVASNAVTVNAHDPAIVVRMPDQPAPANDDADPDVRPVVLDELNWLFKASGILGASASLDGDEVVIVMTSPPCDRAALVDLRDTLSSFKIDAGRNVRALRCATGARLVLQ